MKKFSIILLFFSFLCVGWLNATDYYLKHPWGGGTEWTWKKLTQDSNNTNIYFIKDKLGHTGCNYNTEGNDCIGECWIPIENMTKVGNPKQGDSVLFEYNINDISITITLISKSTEPVATKYYIKHGWGSEWAWKELTQDSENPDLYFLRDTYEGTGCNYNTVASGDGTYIETPELVDNPQKGDSAIFTLDINAKTITITKISSSNTPDDPDEPSTLPDNVYLTSADEICIFYNANGQAINTNIHCYVWGGTIDNGWPGGEATDLGNDYWKFTVPANCGTPTQCIWNTGNGGSQTKNLSYTNHAIYNGETIGEIVTKIYSATPDDPEQPTTYYIKHAWGTGQEADLSWKQLTQETTNTTLYYVNALFGGTGCYFDTTQSGDNPPFIAQQSLGLQGEPTAGDSARFELNITDSTITITKIIPEDPNPEPTVNYYLVGSFGKDGDEKYYWDPATGMPLNDDSIILNLAAGTYSFRLLSSNTEWDQNMGYAQVNAECSSDGYLEGGNDNNIKINLVETGDVKIKVVNESICLTGSFSSEIDITSYTIVGDSTLTGYNWLTTATDNDMENEFEGVWKLLKTDRTLYKDITYMYKVVGNHNYNVSQYPGDNATLSVPEDGIYTITFTYQPTLTEGDKLTATAERTGNIPESPVTNYYLKHAWNGGDATWKQLTQDTTNPNLYYISDIYGGGQSSYTTDTTTGESTQIENPTLEGDPIVGDSVKFTLNPSARTLTITFISRPTTPDTPDDPQPTTYRYALVTETPSSWIGKYLIGYTIDENTVDVYPGINNVSHDVEVVGDIIELDTDTFMIKIDTISTGGYGVQILTGDKRNTWISAPSSGKGCDYNSNPTAVTNISLDGDNNVSIISGSGKFQYNSQSPRFQFYTSTQKLPQLYRLIEDEEPTPEPTANYYLVGSFADINWKLETARPLVDDSIVLENLPAGTYTFRLLTAAKDWNNSLGYTNIDAECSYEGYQAGPDQNNIQITLAEDRTEKDVMISVEDGKICLLGEFTEPPVVSITSYTIVGDSLLTGANWKADNVLNDMTTNEDSLVWTLTKIDVALTAGTYNYKVVANHAWNVEDYPVGLDNNATLIIGEDGIYNITFTYQPNLTEGEKLTAEATKTGDIPEPPITNYFLKHSWNGTTATWKQLTQDTTNTDLYTISDIYGGGLSSYTTDTLNGESTQIENPTLDETLIAGDSVKFTLNLSDGTLTITFISRPTTPDTPDDPQPTTYRYALVTETPTSWIGEYVLGYRFNNDGKEVLRAFPGVDGANAYYDIPVSNNIIETDTCLIKIDTASTEGYTIQILTGTNKGKWVYKSGTSNGINISDNENTVSNIELVDSNYTVKITGNSMILKYNTSTNNGQRFRFYGATNSYPLPQLYRLMDSTATDTTDTPDVQDTVYTLVGDETLTGANWKVDYTANDLKKATDGTWILNLTDINLTAGSYKYVVVMNHIWNENTNYPKQDSMTLIVDADGTYNITFTYQPNLTESDKLSAEATLLPTINYYLVGEFPDPYKWNLETARPLVDDSIVLENLPAGIYWFRLLSSKSAWDQKMGYEQINADCSSEGYLDFGNDNNIKIILAEDGDVKIKVLDGKICLTGNFTTQVTISSYTIAGDSLLTGANWKEDFTANDMTTTNDSLVWTLTKTSVALTAGTYNYKVVANHTWGVADHPASGNQQLQIETDGIYTITFTYQPNLTEGEKLTAEATKTGDIPEPPITNYFLKHSWNGTTATWKQLTQDTTNPNLYYICDIYGDGNNYYTTNTTTGESTQIENPTLDETLIAGDSVKFVLNISEGTLTITFISRPTTPDTPDDPQPTTYRYALVTETPTSWIGKYLIGYTIDENTVGVYPGINNVSHDVEVVGDIIELDTDTFMIKIDTISTGGYGVQILTGDKRNTWISAPSSGKGCDYNSNPTAVTNISLDEDNNVSIISGSGKFQYNSQSPRFQFYTSTQKLPQLYRLIEDEEPTPDDPKPTTTYTIISDNTVLFPGEAWAIDDTNDMTPIDEDSSLWTLTKNNIAFTEPVSILYKAVKNHERSENDYPQGDIYDTLIISQTGTYNITFTYKPNAEGNKLTATADRTGDIEPINPELNYYLKQNGDAERWIKMTKSPENDNVYYCQGIYQRVACYLSNDTTEQPTLAIEPEDFVKQKDPQVGDNVIFTIDVTDEPVKMTITKIEDVPTVNYYLIGSYGTQELTPQNALSLVNDTIIIPIPAAQITATFRLLTSSKDLEDENNLGYADVDSECSSTGYYNAGDIYNSIMITTAQAGNVMVTVKDGKICVTGAFVIRDDPQPQPSTKRRYQLVTQTPTSWSGEYIIGYRPEINTLYAYNCGADAISNYTEVEIVDDAIEMDSTDCQIRIEASNNSDNETYGIELIGNNTGKWLAENGTSNKMTLLNAKYEFTISLVDSDATVRIVPTADMTRSFMFNSTSDQMRFRFYTGPGTQNAQHYLHLYKLMDNTATDTTDIPDVQDTVYTLVGDKALTGADWKVNYTANDLKKAADGTWILNLTDINLTAGSYKYVVVMNHTWNENTNYPKQDSMTLIVEADGTYNISFTYSPDAPENILTDSVSIQSPEQPIEYYIKHKWGNNEWTWKKLTADTQDTNLYFIRDIYGGTGCNFNITAIDSTATWIELPTLIDNPSVGDSAVFTLNTADSTITITKIKPTDTTKRDYSSLCIKDTAEMAIFYDAKGQTVNSNIYLVCRVDHPNDSVTWLQLDIPAEEVGDNCWKAIVPQDKIGTGSISECYWMNGEDTNQKTQTLNFSNHSVYYGNKIWDEPITTLCPETALPEYITETSSKARCIIENGTVYIIRNNGIYTLMGQKVK